MATQAVPPNYPRVTPYLAIDGAGAAIEFYKKAFGATERMRFGAPGGKIGLRLAPVDVGRVGLELGERLLGHGGRWRFAAGGGQQQRRRGQPCDGPDHHPRSFPIPLNSGR